ncbi:hypothetical protein [Lutibaculum baratangense]|nr:hypothetical protein [Lutibaculum baratangense]
MRKRSLRLAFLVFGVIAVLGVLLVIDGLRLRFEQQTPPAGVVAGASRGAEP